MRGLVYFCSLPYQNSAGFQILRSEAAQAAAQKLKDDYGATIFCFGDFRPLTLQPVATMLLPPMACRSAPSTRFVDLWATV